jgi:hypothetical protein
MPLTRLVSAVNSALCAVRARLGAQYKPLKESVHIAGLGNSDKWQNLRLHKDDRAYGRS